MILFFNLDICQQLAQLRFRKFENIGIVFGRNHFFCTNAVGCQEAVVWEHSLSFVHECVKNNVQVDYFPYPCHEHNVIGKDRVHLMDKVTMYFEDYL